MKNLIKATLDAFLRASLLFFVVVPFLAVFESLASKRSYFTACKSMMTSSTFLGMSLLCFTMGLAYNLFILPLSIEKKKKIAHFINLQSQSEVLFVNEEQLTREEYRKRAKAVMKGEMKKYLKNPLKLFWF